MQIRDSHFKRNQNGTSRLSTFAPIAVIALVAVIGGRALIASHAATCTDVEYTLGGSGQCVTDVQNLLNYDLFGFSSSSYLVPNGQFDTQTAASVKSLQAQRSLPMTGAVDIKTWPQICTSGQPGTPPSWWTNAFNSAGCG